MHSHAIRVGLSFIVGLGCWFGKVQAQAPANSPIPLPRVLAVDQSEPVRRAVPPSAVPLSDDPGQAQPAAKGRVGNWLLRHGYTCGQNLNWYGCGGWHAQNQFVFGSCRVFFIEPCLPNTNHGRGGSCPGGCAK